MTVSKTGPTRRNASLLIGSAVLAGGVFSPGFPAIAATPKKTYDLTPLPVADGIWMIEGATDYFTSENGGAIVNCTLIETKTGLVIIDTGPSLRYGEALQKIASQLGVVGIAGVFNTHHHPDHFFGNQVFKNSPIHAIAGTKKLAETEGEAFSDNMYHILGDWMRGTEVVPPNSVLTSSAITIGEREFGIYPLEGHTGADLAILDKKTGTLITGDLAFLNRAPTTPHADVAKWQTSLDALAQIKASAIIPGHGPLDKSGQSLVQTKAYLTWLDKALKTAAAEGLSMVEIAALPIPPEFAGMGAMPQEFTRSISHLYPEIERKVLPLTNR